MCSESPVLSTAGYYAYKLCFHRHPLIIKVQLISYCWLIMIFRGWLAVSLAHEYHLWSNQELLITGP